MINTFSPNGGDLGRAAEILTPLEFSVILPPVARILEYLYHTKLSKLPFKYAFEFHSSHKAQIELVMMTTKLPPNVGFYECDGLKLFQIRGASGGIVTSYICYLITEDIK